jgi:tetratricopeptide (TPR) repeat protein
MARRATPILARWRVAALAAALACASACVWAWRPIAAQVGPTPPDSAALRAAESRAGTAADLWLAIAGGWLARRDTVQAMRVLETGLTSAKETRRLRVVLAELRLRRGDPTSALRLLAPLPAGDTLAAPVRAVAEVQRALTGLANGDTAQALAALERAWRATRAEATGIALVQLARAARSPRGAILADSLALRPDASPMAFAIAADAAQAQGRFAHADSVLVRGTARWPRRGDLWLALGGVRKTRRAWREGAQAYLRAATVLDEPAPAELALARLYLAQGDTGAARATWRAMIGDRRAPDAMHAAARRLARFGDASAADSAWRRLLARDPFDGRAWAGRAALAEAAQHRDSAIALWRVADERPGAGAWPGLALVRLLPAQDTSARRRAASRALWRGLAELQTAERATGTGAREVGGDAASEDGGDDDGALLRTQLQPLADSLARDSAWGQAEVASAVRAFGAGRLLLLATSRAARARGDLRTAVDAVSRLVQREPGDVALRSEFAGLLLDAGRRDDARMMWAQMLEDAPEDSVPFRALVRLAATPDDLERVASQIGRLRERRPGSIALAERALEVWHRLGREEPAARAANDLATLRRRATGAKTP